jgi:hypothetical protein
MQRPSLSDHDGTTWSTGALPIGAVGLDLRSPAAPSTLVELLNARFRDAKIERRNGHTGYRVVAGAPYMTGSHSDRWVYGHGGTAETWDADGTPRTYIPLQKHGRATFNFEGSDVVFTGDRLFTLRTDGFPSSGASILWNQGLSSGVAEKGIPAYLPSMTETPTPFGVEGEAEEHVTTGEVSTCLTTTLRVYAHTTSAGVGLQIYDRATGALLDATEILEVSHQIRVVNSAEMPVVLYKAESGNTLYEAHWTGSEWSTPSSVDTGVGEFDVAIDANGFHLAWISGGAVQVGQYLRGDATNATYPFGTVITGYAGVPLLVAIGVAPSHEVAFAIGTDADAVDVRAYTSAMLPITGAAWVSLPTGELANVTIVSRGLINDDYRYNWVVHAGRADADTGVLVTTYVHTSGSAGLGGTLYRANCALASRSFRVGEEVFAWLHSAYSATLFLLVGTLGSVVAGYADREEAMRVDYLIVATSERVRPLAYVQPDPLDPFAFTWARPYFDGLEYSHPGNARVGDMHFDAVPSIAHFGRSVYLSGSAVKNWDGESLEDAGFQDYPVVLNAVEVPADGDIVAGARQFRVYAVRYNARGERFQSAALTSSLVTTVDAAASITLTISTIPTGSTDVTFEVFRTTAGGTTFYFDGTVANVPTTPTVEYSSTISDGDLDDRVGDPHETGVAATDQLESWGPIGCTLLVAIGDRLYSAGGQVPAGCVQYSKLWAPNQGAGHDDINGVQTIDAEGGEITSIAAGPGATVVFERDRLYLLGGDGPNNYGIGAYAVPQMVTADGAITHLGTLNCQEGTLFWGVGGPRLLTRGFQVVNISEPVFPLSDTLTPSGARVDLARREVVWYTEGGTALLWNYAGGSRWARWSGLKIAGVSPEALLTTDCVVLHETPDVGDAGHAFTFKFATGNIRPEDILQGFTLLRMAGLVGEHRGPHTLRFRFYYDGSPLWSESLEWEPETATWLAAGDAVEDLTPAEVDALLPTDRSGGYGNNKRVRRQTCQYFRVEVSDISSDHPTFIPYALSFELGAKPGLGRGAVNTYTRG